MGQMGFFDIANRYAGLDAKNDPLARIDAVVPWENFRARLEAIWRKPAEERKSPAGRKPYAVAMFRRSFPIWTTKWSTSFATASRSCGS